MTWPCTLFQGISIGVACLLMEGCATVFQGRTQTIGVAADSIAARVHVNDRPASVAPGEITVPRRAVVTIRLEADGFRPKEIRLKRGLSPWLLADLAWCFVAYQSTKLLEEGHRASVRLAGAFWWGVAPTFAVDFLTGAAFRQRPSRIDARLHPEIHPEAVP